ncbi:restriction endonuclease subunit S [Shewanella xiamenensis]|uniref:Specificity determinant for hsdM and hsdR n=1 Tax=Shewanella xiamenensis TaxID=332186 RepID=A0AAW6R1H4_9GAMM|nr:restriction endonuclease subunit S [Shewanella xiamenensis]MDG5901551.1 specificity determinant for hsdM and hsdR [Shewanella xiamenensis]
MNRVDSMKWLNLNIGDIADVVAGGTPKAGNPENFKQSGTGIGWLTPADLSGYSEKYIRFGARDLSQVGYESSSAKLLPKGSLLFSSRAPIGYVAIAQNEIATNQGFKNFVFPFGVNSDYAYYYLRSIKNIAESLGTGTTFKEISGATAKTLPFVLPPLAEQKVIADKLDTLLAQVETTKARLERIPEILKRFRQSVLSAAVSGKLTEEWRKEFQGLIDRTQFLKKLDCERRRRFDEECERLTRKGKYKVAITEIPEDLPELPISWMWISVDALASKVTDGVHKKPVYVEDGIPFVTVKNMTKGPGISFDELNYVTKDDHIEFCRRTNPERGDILISKDGTLGVVRQIRTDVEFSIFVSVALVKPVLQSMSNYLELAFQAPVMQQQMVGVGSGLQHIHLTDLRKDCVPVPPLKEQTEIVRRVEELFAFADSIEQKATAASERVNNLTQSILAKAFRGELTADWRAANPELISGDNSAEALLAKIKAERAALVGKKTRKKA